MYKGINTKWLNLYWGRSQTSKMQIQNKYEFEREKENYKREEYNGGKGEKKIWRNRRE